MRLHGLGCFHHTTPEELRGSLFMVEEFVGTMSLKALLRWAACLAAPRAQAGRASTRTRAGFSCAPSAPWDCGSACGSSSWSGSQQEAALQQRGGRGLHSGSVARGPLVLTAELWEQGQRSEGMGEAAMHIGCSGRAGAQRP